MKLSFRMPGLYITRFGDHPEINEFCEKICEIANKYEYSTKLDIINIIPWILPENLLSDGYGKEFTKIELKYKIGSIARQIDFDLYQNATIEEKKTILMEFLFKTLAEIQKKIGFDLETFKKDVSHLK